MGFILERGLSQDSVEMRLFLSLLKQVRLALSLCLLYLSLSLSHLTVPPPTGSAAGAVGRRRLLGAVSSLSTLFTQCGRRAASWARPAFAHMHSQRCGSARRLLLPSGARQLLRSVTATTGRRRLLGRVRSEKGGAGK
jgi:hypothetical protein